MNGLKSLLVDLSLCEEKSHGPINWWTFSVRRRNLKMSKNLRMNTCSMSCVMSWKLMVSCFFFSFHLLFVKMCLMMSRKNWIFDKFLSIWYHSDFMLFLFYTLYLRYFFKTRRCNSSGENKININYTYIGYFKLIFSKNNGRLVI